MNGRLEQPEPYLKHSPKACNYGNRIVLALSGYDQVTVSWTVGNATFNRGLNK